MWWGVLSKLAETKNNLSAFNAKSKGGRAKTKEAWPQPFGLDLVIRSVANFWPYFGGFLQGWRGLPVHSINITI